MRLTATQRNVLNYILIAIGGAVLATGVQLGAVLAGDGDILVRPLASTFVNTMFGTLAAVFGAMRLPRAGSEALATLVNEVGKPAAKAALDVVAIKQKTGVGPSPPLDAEEIVTRVADEVERRRKARTQRLREQQAVTLKPETAP